MTTQMDSLSGKRPVNDTTLPGLESDRKAFAVPVLASSLHQHSLVEDSILVSKLSCSTIHLTWLRMWVWMHSGDFHCCSLSQC